MHLESESTEQQINPYTSALEPVWEKVRTAASMMTSLREEKQRLVERVAALEQEVRHKADMLAAQGAEVEHLKSLVESLETSPHAPVQCPAVIGPDERVLLQQKIKNALSKIDAHLSAS
ncbi:MAG: hypothetical protein WCQ44_06400 [Opitutaceae bacterium]|jgi:hypothetical protein